MDYIKLFDNIEDREEYKTVMTHDTLTAITGADGEVLFMELGSDNGSSNGQTPDDNGNEPGPDGPIPDDNGEEPVNDDPILP